MAILSLSLQFLVISWITTKRQLIHNRTASRNGWNAMYDFIIVGAGTAGCVVARRLAENGQVSVLLLEAGGAQNDIYNDIPGLSPGISSNRPDLQWNYYNEPQKNAGLQFFGGRIPEAKGKTIGGSSSHNGLVFNRGHRKGFDEWEHKYGAKGWSYEGVLPFFKKFENNTDPHIVAASPGYHGIMGPVQISTPKEPGQYLLRLKRVYNSLGFMDTDINGPNQTGTMIDQSFIGLDGFRSSAGTAYVDPNPFPNNLHIVTKAMVTKILFSGLTAVGVEFAKNDKPFRVYAQKEVIISAGPINSPQLLMLSGVGPKQHLQDFRIPVLIDLPVGDNLANQPRINAVFPPAPDLNRKELCALYFNRSGLLSQAPRLLTYFSTRNNDNREWPNAILYSQPNLLNTTQLLTSLDMVKVRSKGTIRLQSTDPYIPPLVNTNFLSDPRDFEDAVDATKFFFFVMELPTVTPYTVVPNFESLKCPSCPGLKTYQCDIGIRCFIKYSTKSTWHPGGSCRMGAVNRTDVVVDPSLRVKYTRNLRVCDSSIFPDLPNANTNAASLMVGEKCAQIIRDYYSF